MKLRLFCLLITSAAFAFLAACGDSSPVVTFTSPPTSVSAGATVPFTVTVAHSSKGVTWSLSCDTSSNPTPQCGTLTDAAALTVNYQAPVSVLTGTVVLTATSVDDVARTATASFTVGAPSAVALPDGNYVFQLSGQDTNGTFNAAGAFTIASGAITGGEEDFTDALFVLAGLSITNASTITATPDGNLQIILQTGNSKIGVGGNGLQTFNLAVTSNAGGTTTTGGLLNWFDTFATGVGQLSFQDATSSKAAPSGGFAFVTSGGDLGGCAGSIGGVINVDNSPGAEDISGAGSVIDINVCGALSQGKAIPASTVIGPDSFGRVLVNLNLTPTVNYAGYIVSSGKVVLVETTDGLSGNTGGVALSQGSLAGGFSSASISGQTYVVVAQGSDANGSLTFAAALTFNSDGSISGTADFNDIANQFSGTAAAASANYTVDATGRVTVTRLLVQDSATSTLYGPITLQLYLDGNGNATAVSMDRFDSFAGPAFLQTAGATLAGNYALNAFGTSGTTADTWSVVGHVSSDGSGFTDSNYLTPSHPIATDVPLSGMGASGPLTITGLGADSVAAGTPTSNTFNTYVIDSNRAFGVETDNVQLGLFYALFQN